MVKSSWINRRTIRAKKQAFSEIGLVSGRGTVQLNDDKQFDTDKFYFGFRGGRLDLNGHSLTLSVSKIRTRGDDCEP